MYYFSRINVDRQLQPHLMAALLQQDFSRINVDRQLQRNTPMIQIEQNFSRINVDRQLQLLVNAGVVVETLAGSMWTGNYNGVAGGRRRGAERRRRGVRHQPEKSALGRGWGAGGKGNTSRASRGVPLPPVNLPPPSPRISTNLPQAAQLLDALRRRG